MGALDGLLVVALEQAVAAPLCTAKLADAGARVIKIERAEGDFARGYDDAVKGQASYFVWLNRGKESLTLDIKNPDDKALLERLIAKADVFVQNLAPGATTRAGIGAEKLRQRHPSLITVDISGYGEEGPLAEMKAYDLLVQAESGLCSVTGTPEGMARVGVSVGDIGAGMNAYAAVLEALIKRGTTGQGSAIKVSLFDGLADWMNVPYLQFAYGGKEPERNGLNHPTIAPYGAYSGSDGKDVLFSIQNEREWANFCRDVLERPEVATDSRFTSNSRRVAHRAELDAIINEVFSAHTRDALADRLRDARIAFGRVSTMDDLVRHPQNRHVEADTPTGPVRLLAPGALVDGKSPEFGPVPALGADTDRVRAEFSRVEA